MSEDGQFPGFCLPIHQRGQTLYHSNNLPSFLYPSDGILVQFKLDSIPTGGFSQPRLPRTTAVWQINHRRSVSRGWKVPKASGGECPGGTYRSTSSCAGGSGRGGKEEMAWEGLWRR